MTIVAVAWSGSRRVALALLVAGWMLLPVERFPAETITPSNFTVDFIGTALPSQILVTRAWVVPVAVLLGLVLQGPGLWRHFRLLPVDLLMGIFCLSPFLPWMSGRLSALEAVQQSGYLFGFWGATWLVGRLLLCDLDGRRALADVLIWSGLALLPIALLEGSRQAWLYVAAYGAHPFQLEGGSARYIGFRPLGFFEQSNQYGIWIAMAALAALHRCLATDLPVRRDQIVAIVLNLAAIASQSVGALLLLAGGSAWLAMRASLRRSVTLALAVVLALGGAGYVSGKVPLERWASTSASGQLVMKGLDKIGRKSLAYRVRRDQLALPLIARAPLSGYGHWDWWRPLKSRPWGLPLLVAGQYGILSALVLSWVLLAGAARRLLLAQPSILALVVALAAVDAWLNSFIYMPAVLAAAACAIPLTGARSRSPDSAEGQPQDENPLAAGPVHA
ncbi:hypothetical protein ACFOON_11590 [Novosphingobium piscinae]